MQGGGGGDDSSTPLGALRAGLQAADELDAAAFTAGQGGGPSHGHHLWPDSQGFQSIPEHPAAINRTPAEEGMSLSVTQHVGLMMCHVQCSGRQKGGPRK